MANSHKNKTFATFLASAFGGLGAHRFYLYGMKDFWAWAHFLTAPISLLAIGLGASQPRMFVAGLFVISVLAGFIEALVIGLTPDDKWDVLHNRNSGHQSASGWLLAVLLVLTTGVGATAIIAAMARTFDLLYTGGSYG
jgi:hypothetical protein